MSTTLMRARRYHTCKIKQGIYMHPMISNAKPLPSRPCPSSSIGCELSFILDVDTPLITPWVHQDLSGHGKRCVGASIRNSGIPTIHHVWQHNHDQVLSIVTGVRVTDRIRLRKQAAAKVPRSISTSLNPVPNGGYG